MLSTITDEDSPTAEMPAANRDTEFPLAIPMEYIVGQRRWLAPVVVTGRANHVVHHSRRVEFVFEVTSIAPTR
jgi:hypothetical protein